MNPIDPLHACAFTGHRQEKLPWRGQETDPRCVQLKRYIYDAVEAVYMQGVRYYLCGMATGCDLYFCEAVLQLRQERPGVALEAVIPYEGQSKGWAEETRRRYDRLVTECDFQTVLSHDYTSDCMMRRNRYMVDHSGWLIAAYNGRSGGTRNTLLYAMRQGLRIIQVPVEE